MKIFSKNKNAFTIVELMVIISIITIIAIWWSQINLNRLSSKQKLEIFNNKIVNLIETTRNNSLLWKWIWNNFIVPDSWRIDLSESNSWTIISSYLSWWTWYNYDDNSLVVYDSYYINNFRCSSLTWVTTNFSAWTWTILISWNDLSLSGCTNPNYKIMLIDLTFGSHRNRIKINTLNWLVESSTLF